MDDTRLLEWRGCAVVDRDRMVIGTVESIYFEHQTDLAKWVLILSAAPELRRSLIPLADAVNEGDQIAVPYTVEQVRLAPVPPAGDELGAEAEAELFAHYGLTYTGMSTDMGPPSPHERAAAPSAADSTQELELGPPVGRPAPGRVRRLGDARLARYSLAERGSLSPGQPPAAPDGGAMGLEAIEPGHPEPVDPLPEPHEPEPAPAEVGLTRPVEAPVPSPSESGSPAGPAPSGSASLLGGIRRNPVGFALGALAAGVAAGLLKDSGRRALEGGRDTVEAVRKGVERSRHEREGGAEAPAVGELAPTETNVERAGGAPADPPESSG